MRHITLFLVCLLAMVLPTRAQSSAGKVSLKLVDGLVGTWKLSKIYEGKKELPVNSQVGLIDHIEFTETNMYMSRTNESKADSGFFRTNEIDKILYLESANKVVDNITQEWELKINANTMTLTRKEPVEMKRFNYVYTKQNIPKNK